MNFKAKSIRTFLGSKNFKIAKKFYAELGFKESVIDNKMSFFQIENSLGFYLQDYYVKEWVQNSMVFLEVENLSECYQQLLSKQLDKKFSNIKITKIKNEDWGSEFHLIDPSGVLWHFAELTNNNAL